MIRKAGTEKKDQHLVEKARAGNQNAFGQLVKMHQNYILYLAYDFVNNYQDAKDIAQTAFIQAYEKLDQFQGRGPFRAWLSRITINLCKTYFRKKNKHDVVSIYKEDGILNYSDPNASGDTLKMIEDQELHKQILAYVDHLSTNQQTAIILKYFQNKSSKEIATIIGCAENTVRIHLSRGIQKLREHASVFKQM